MNIHRCLQAPGATATRGRRLSRQRRDLVAHQSGQRAGHVQSATTRLAWKTSAILTMKHARWCPRSIAKLVYNSVISNVFVGDISKVFMGLFQQFRTGGGTCGDSMGCSMVKLHWFTQKCRGYSWGWWDVYIYNGIYHQLLKSETRWYTHIGGWSSIHVHRYLYHIPVCRDSYDGTDEHKPYTMFWPWPIHVCDLYHDWDHFRVKPSRTCFGKLELEFWLVNKNLDVVVQGVPRYIKRLTIRLMRYL